MNIFQFFKDVISPKKCYQCKKLWHFFCPQCFEKFKTYNEFCYECKGTNRDFQIHEACQKSWNFDAVIILGRYKNYPLQKLIADGKYYGRKEIYYDMGLYLSKLFLKHHTIVDKDKYVIVSAPMHFFRRWKRGYNHSHILAQKVSKELGILYNSRIIVKKKYTKQQSHLTREERLKNLTGVFFLDSQDMSYLKWKTIILIDDVISTGATLNELAKILKESGVKKVVWLVIASD